MKNTQTECRNCGADVEVAEIVPGMHLGNCPDCGAEVRRTND